MYLYERKKLFKILLAVIANIWGNLKHAKRSEIISELESFCIEERGEGESKHRNRILAGYRKQLIVFISSKVWVKNYPI